MLRGMGVGAGTPQAAHRACLWVRGSVALTFLLHEPGAVEGLGFSCAACMEEDYYLPNYGVVHKAFW